MTLQSGCMTLVQVVSGISRKLLLGARCWGPSAFKRSQLTVHLRLDQCLYNCEGDPPKKRAKMSEKVWSKLECLES